MANFLTKKFRGFVDPAKAGKAKTIQVSYGKTWVRYVGTFPRKSDLDRAKKWCLDMLANNVRSYKTAGGYELWINE